MLTVTLRDEEAELSEVLSEFLIIISSRFHM